MQKSKYSEFLCERRFINKVSKQAYLDACKWLAVNVYSKPDLSKFITVQVEKEGKKTFIVRLFMTVDEKEISDNHCQKCKHLHTIFYSIEKPDCSKCKMRVYKKCLHDNVKNMVDFWKGEFEGE